MIICFEGTPGSGKTYDAVRKIMDNLRLGRVVYTNIRGFDDQDCLEHIKTYLGLSDYQIGHQLRFLKEEQICQFYDSDITEAGSLIVLDEAQNYFNSREWQSEKNKGFARWSSTHRHHGFDLVIITQDIERIDTAVRSLVEWTYRYKKMNFFGSMFFKNSYICYSYALDGSGKMLGKKVKSYDSKIFRCYMSYAAKDIKELGIMSHMNVLRHPIFYALPVVIGFFLYMFWNSGFRHGEIIPGTMKIKQNQQKLVQQHQQSQQFNQSSYLVSAAQANNVVPSQPFASTVPLRPYPVKPDGTPDLSSGFSQGVIPAVQASGQQFKNNHSGLALTSAAAVGSLPPGVYAYSRSDTQQKQNRKQVQKYTIVGYIGTGYNVTSYYMYDDGKWISIFDLDSMCDCDSMQKYKVGDLLDVDGL